MMVVILMICNVIAVTNTITVINIISMMMMKKTKMKMKMKVAPLFDENTQIGNYNGLMILFENRF